MIEVKNGTWEYVETFKEAQEVAAHINDLLDNTKDDYLRVAVDCETRNQNPNLPPDTAPRPIICPGGFYEGLMRLFQIGLDPKIEDIQFVLDVEKIGKPKELGNLFRRPLTECIIVGQNLRYDFGYIEEQMGVSMNEDLIRDLMLMGQIEFAGDKKSHNMTSLVRRYLKEDLFVQQFGMTFDEFEAFKKEEQKSGWTGELSRKQLWYSSIDVKLPFLLYDSMLESLQDFRKTWEVRNERNQSITNAILLECQVMPAYSDAELLGIQFDVDHHENVVIPILKEKMAEAEAEVSKYFTRQVQKSNGKRGKNREVWFVDECIMLTSPAQIKTALTEAGVKLPDKDATSEKVLKKLAYQHPSIPHILKYKKASSLNSKFGAKLADAARLWNGRIHPHWFQIGSDDTSIDTGRSSCKDPNLMQIPNKEDDVVKLWGVSLSELFRRSFISRPGYSFIDADYSQIEPCVQSEKANELVQIRKFQEAHAAGKKLDTHWLTAQSVFGIEYAYDSENPDHVKMRQVGKVLNLGIAYGMGATKLAASITEATGQPCSIQQAYDYITNYYNNLPGIKAKKAEVEREVKRIADQHESLIPFAGRKPFAVMFTTIGRPRRWCLKMSEAHNQEEIANQELQLMAEERRKTGILDKWYNGGKRNTYNERLSEASREAYNFIIQGTCADMLKQAAVYIRKAFIEAGFDRTERVLLFVHDEIVAEVKDENVEKAKKIVEDCMLKAAAIVCKRVPVTVGIGVAKNWADAH